MSPVHASPRPRTALRLAVLAAVCGSVAAGEAAAQPPPAPDVCGSIQVAARRSSVGRTTLTEPLRLVLPATVALAADPPRSVELVELGYQASANGRRRRAVCNYAWTEGSAPGRYSLVFCSSGARAGSVIETRDLTLRVLGWRREAAADIVLPRFNCTPNVPTTAPLNLADDTPVGMDTLGFLRARHSLLSRRFREVEHPTTGWQPIPELPSPVASVSTLIIDGAGAFASRQPLAATTFGNGVWVFGVDGEGRIRAQVYEVTSSIGAWRSAWAGIPGDFATNARVAAAATASRLYVFARHAATGAVHVTSRPLGCAGGTLSGCWSGWAAAPLSADLGPASLAAASDGARVHLVVGGPYARLPLRSRGGLKLATWHESVGAWSPYRDVELPSSTGLLPRDAVATDTPPSLAWDDSRGVLRLYGRLRRMPASGSELPTTLGLVRLSANPLASGPWTPCVLPRPALPLELRALSPAASILEGAETLVAVAPTGRLTAQTGSGDDCPAWSEATPADGSGLSTPDSPAVAALAGTQRAAHVVVAARDASGAAVAQVLTTFRLQALRVSDGRDAAGNPKAEASLTPDQFQSWTDRANAIWVGADVRFVFAKSLDFQPVEDPRLNLTDLCDAKVSSSTTCITESYGNEVAARYPRKILVLSRYGSTVDGTGARTAEGGGWSWWTYDFVAMPGFPVTAVCPSNRQNIGLLAHELGHQLGLVHTFGPDPRTAADPDPAKRYRPFVPATAKTWLEENAGNLWAAFDADASSDVLDTDPDPGDQVAAACDASATTLKLSTTLGLFEWTPPRLNLMSYYAPIDASGQLELHEPSPDQVTRVYRLMPR